MGAFAGVLFLELFLLLLLLCFLYFDNVVDCQNLLEEAGRLGLIGGSCRSLMLRVVVAVTMFFCIF